MFRSYKRRSPKFRSMQRIKSTRWPARNPLGDRLFYKAVFSIGGHFVGNPAAANWVIENNGQFNSFPDLMSFVGNNLSPGLDILGGSFENYRVRGVAFTYTVFPTPDAATHPFCIFADASADGEWPTTMAVNVAPELRWCKYRVCGVAGAGAKPTVFKVYFSTNKVYGPDKVVKNSMQFLGNTNNFNPSPVTWNPPALGPWLRTGIFSLSGDNLPTDGTILANYMVRMKVYVEFFGKKNVII